MTQEQERALAQLVARAMAGDVLTPAERARLAVLSRMAADEEGGEQ